jgi:hypothetical protein
MSLNISKLPLNAKDMLETQGYFKDTLALSESIYSATMSKNYNELDRLFQLETAPGGYLFNYLLQFTNFDEMEFIISLRESKNEWEEDGIWHDDGSRVLAFSLSLTKDINSISGGDLHIRKRGSVKSSVIKPFSFGEIIVFLTGTSGFEHKIHKVEKGERLIIAGWCS